MNEYIKVNPMSLPKTRFLDMYMANHKGFIAGGAFKNIFNGQKLKDIDIFFENESDFSQAKEYFKTNENYIFSYENANTISYKNKSTNIRVELIHKHYGKATEILDMFDFSITKMAYYRDVNDNGSTSFQILHHSNYFSDLINKKLVLEKNILYPISTFERSYRYCKYGYGLCRESKENLIKALQNSNVEDISNDLYFGID